MIMRKLQLKGEVPPALNYLHFHKKLCFDVENFPVVHLQFEHCLKLAFDVFKFANSLTNA